MSRVEKGSTKFRPALPRSQKPTSIEKPRSSTGPPNGTASTTQPIALEDVNLLSTQDSASFPLAAAGTTTESAPLFAPRDAVAFISASTVAQVNGATPQPGSNPSSLGQPTTIKMPGSTSRGNAIIIPGQRRPSTNPSVTSVSSFPLTGSSSEDLLSRSTAPENHAEGRKRKAIDISGHQESPSSSGSKKRHTSPRAQEPTIDESATAPIDDSRSGLALSGTVGDANNFHSASKRPVQRHRKPRPRVDRTVTQVPEEGAPIDETIVTMRDLANGLGQGRVSGRFLETFMKSNEATRRKREDNARLRELTRRKELGLPIDEEEFLGDGRPLRSTGDTVQIHNSQEGEDTNLQERAQERGGEEEEEGDEYTGIISTIQRAPKIRYDAAGNIVIDETELEYDRQAEADEELAARGPMEVIEESDRDKFTNFASFSRKPRPDRWSKEETETFYLGLRMFHTGFDLIARLLPNRTRTMVRNKFRAEDRKNPQKITNLLSHKMRLPYDLELLARETGHNFSGPIPQIEARNLDEENKEENGAEEDDPLKQRESTAPLSVGEPDRVDIASVSISTASQGRQATKGKDKKISSKPTSKPPSIIRGVSLPHASEIFADLEKEGEQQPRQSEPRPPIIGSARPPTIRSAVPKDTS